MLNSNAAQDLPCAAAHAVRRRLITAGGTLALVVTLGGGSLRVIGTEAASKAAATPAATSAEEMARQDTDTQTLSVADVAEIANPAVVTVNTFTDREAAPGGF